MHIRAQAGWDPSATLRAQKGGADAMTTCFFTKKQRLALPPLYATEGQPDPIAWVRFFTPDSFWTWYVVEFDGRDLCFGLVRGQATELGYFQLSELATGRGPLGVPIERDDDFQPTRLSLLTGTESDA